MSLLVKNPSIRKSFYGNSYRIAENALKASSNISGLLNYKEFIPKAEQLKRTLSSQKEQEDKKNHEEVILFVDKNIKNFNIKEVQALIKTDVKNKDIKFRLTSNNRSLREESINPDFRRLLNNGLNYGIYMNSPTQAEAFLKKYGDSKYISKPVQITISISKSNGRYSYVEIKEPSKTLFKLPIEVNGSQYNLSTPSLPIITRLYAIGVPSNHPDKSALLKSSYINPLNSTTVPFIEIPKSDLTDLVAIVPKHILDHQKYGSVKPALASDITFPYENKFLPIEELTKVICSIFGIPEPFFTSVPYITNCLFDEEGQRITTKLNNKTIFIEEAFEKISEEESNIFNLGLKRNVKNHKALEITESNIYKIINRNNTFKKGNNLEISPDVLRSVLLENSATFTETYIFADRYNCLELLTASLGVFQNTYYNFDTVSYVNDLDELLISNEKASNNSDRYLLDEFYMLQIDSKEDGNNVGDFVIAFTNYLNYNQFYKQFNGISDERLTLINNLVSNIFIRLFNDQLKYHFPELSFFYLNSKVFRFNEIKIEETELPTDAKLNKWRNYITYKVKDQEQITETLNQKKTNLIIRLVSSMSGLPILPEPFKYRIMINSADDSVSENNEFLNKITNSLPSIGSDIIFNYSLKGDNKKDDSGDLIAKGLRIFRNNLLFNESTTNLYPIRIIDPNDLMPWVRYYHSIQPDLSKLESIPNDKEFLLHFRSALRYSINKLHENHPELGTKYESNQMLAMVDEVSKDHLVKLGFEKFKELYKQLLEEPQKNNHIDEVKSFKQTTQDESIKNVFQEELKKY